MAQSSRPALTAEQKRELWRRWRAGESLSEIGRALGRRARSIHGVVAANGGYAPVPRRRSRRVLSLSEREEISRGLAEGASLRLIARRLGRAPSTVSREVARHGGRRRYRALPADDRAWRRARRPKLCKLAAQPRLRALVAEKLGEEWSPEQISGWLARTYAGEQALQVSTETIYRSLFVQARGVLARELTAHLRTKRTMRRSKNASRKGRAAAASGTRSRSASARPRSKTAPSPATGRATCWPARRTRTSPRWSSVRRASCSSSRWTARTPRRWSPRSRSQVQTLPAQLRASLTWDRGMELAEHKRFSVATDVAVYFCDPQSPWQRGTNENTNGLLRQYFPKKTDLAVHTQDDLDAVAARLNGRPRKTLAFETPADRFAAAVASTT